VVGLMEKNKKIKYGLSFGDEVVSSVAVYVIIFVLIVLIVTVAWFV
jgi:hypothetical protein